MTERKPFQFKKIKEKEYEPLNRPPAWCSAICRNVLNDVCVENCAVYKNCSHFELKKGITILDFPRVSIEDFKRMTRHEKATYLFVSMSAITDHLKGVTNEPNYPPIVRPNTHNQRGSQIPKAVTVKDLLPLLAEEVSSLSDREEPESETLPADEVVRGED